MKKTTLSVILFHVLVSCLSSMAQHAPVVTAMDASTRTWSYVTYSTNADGSVQSSAWPAYIEMATGLNHLDHGRWQPSVPEFELQPGKAVAQRGQHKVSLDANLNMPNAVKLTLPDGSMQKSHVLCLAYYDYASGSNVVIATIKDCSGQLTKPNEVVYGDAFDGVLADVRYTYTIDGLEQDIILREMPAPPSEIGLNDDTTTLQVMTEFPTTPTPRVTAQGNRGHGIDFGSMQLGDGKAFGLHDESRATQVTKGWAVFDGRNFLIEEIPYCTILADSQDLHAAVTKPGKTYHASMARKLPQMAANNPRESKSIMLAQATQSNPGYVIDYKTISTSGNYTFTNGVTYLISGNVSGTFNFQGGAVIKYTNNTSLLPSATSTFGTNINSQTVFTSMNDNSVGDTIVGSTGNPRYTDGGRALMLYADATISNARFRYLTNAIGCDSTTANLLLKHVQIVKCANAIDDFHGRTITLQNCLLAENNKLFTSTPHSTMATNINACNVTFGYNTNFMDYGAPTINLTNSILVGTHPAITTSNSLSLSTTFTNGGAGNYYTLTDKDNGISTINPSLLADLQKMTTYPPIVLAGTINTNLTLAPQAPRDTNTIDRGYHYPAIDYVVNLLTMTNGTSLSVKAGTALAYTFGAGGITSRESSPLTMLGSPTAHVRLFQYTAVQEQGVKLGNTNVTALNSQVIYQNRSGTAPVSLRFVEIANTPGAINTLIYQSDLINPLIIQDSEFGPGLISIYGTSDAQTNNILNNAFNGSSIDWEYGVVTIRNNLFYGCPYFHFDNYGNNMWPIQDNMFFACAPSVRWQDAVIMDHNLTTSTFTFTNGPLGAYYQASTSGIDAGSHLASAAGLYHYTTQTSQAKETNSVVDIGYHYVAVNGLGQSLDSDGDGIPDYLEDSNGNGVYDAGIDYVNWQSADTDGDGLPDGWTLFYFGHPTGQAGDKSRAQDDADSDGISNLQEYINGTNPLYADPISVLLTEPKDFNIP